MAILKEPLFSDEARGQVAKVAVFKRAEVHPVLCALSYHQVNWTPSKINQAMAWKSLCNLWRALSDENQAVWRSAAPGVLTGFNYFMQCKGSLPLPPCYVIPDGDALLFDFIVTEYGPPAANLLNFEWEECI
ncbi:hypothetical protein ES702_02941 [subsurface metagenome]